jgi:hypothetical protein
MFLFGKQPFVKKMHLLASTVTHYRIVSDGYVWYLQYQHWYNFYVFKLPVWEFVYRDKEFDEDEITYGNPYVGLVCSCNTVMVDFVKKWPDVQKYFSQIKKMNTSWNAVSKNTVALSRSQHLLHRSQKRNFDGLVNGI